jgi:hypothetical protein
VRILIVVVLGVAIAGCGSSSSERSSPIPTHAPSPPEPASVPRLAPACAPRARPALAGAVSAPHGSVTAAPFTASNGAAGCRLRARAVEAIVRLDSAPQPYARMEREVVEFGQNVDWTKVPASAYPRTIGQLGLDADWFPLQTRLLTTDGMRLVTVKTKAASVGPTEAKAAATRLARVYLGLLVKPAGY